MKQAIGLTRKGAGKAISLIHGWGMNAAVFEPLSELLRDNFELFGVDLPGYGRSPWSVGADFDSQVDALAEVLPASTLLGWSLGGLYALRLANRYPDKFNGVVLVCCNPCFVQRDDWLCAVESTVFSEFSTALIDDWRATIRRFLGLQMMGTVRVRGLIRHVAALLEQGGEPNPTAMRFGLELLLQSDARQELASLKVPIMEILGQTDSLVPIALAQQLPLLNPAIRVECVARSAHAPFLSHSHEIAGLISEFVEPTSSGQSGG